MKLKLYVIATLIGTALMSSTPSIAAESKAKQLELFGVTLKGATRDQLRQAFKDNGLHATREDDTYWVDTYDAADVLEGASEFASGYVSKTNKFAYATYTFQAFMDTELVAKVIGMVSTKYGRPSSQSGSYGLGNVSAKWNFGQDMQLEVSRGWPATTTYLTYKDASSYRQMQSEIDASKKAQEQQKAKSQNRAF